MDILIFITKIPDGIFKDRWITEYGNIIKNKAGDYTKQMKLASGLIYSETKCSGKLEREYIHILVAKAFLSNIKGHKYVIHIDGNLENNHVSNLEWSKYPDADWKDFKTIPGFSNYKISKTGVIKSYFNKHFPQIMATYIEGVYVRIGLVDDDGVRHNVRIHRAVALAYLPNPNNYPEVDHIDRNPLNNNLENLRWADKDIQMNNRSFGGQLLSVLQFDLDKNFVREFESAKQVVEELELPIERKSLQRYARRNENGLEYARFGFYWQYKVYKERYELQKREKSVKIVGDFGDFELNFPDYEITNFGNVISNGYKLQIVYGNYPKYSLACGANKSVAIYVHILVALFFVSGRTKEKNEVDHIDEDKTNFSVNNLEWVTHQENCLRMRHKICKAVFKHDSETGEIIERFDSAVDAAKSLGRSNSGFIVNCLKGRCDTAYGYGWTYVDDENR